VTEQRKHSAETAAFVSIANTLARGYDAVDLFSGLTTHCADLLGIASAGLLLADGHGTLHLMAASSEKTRDLELFQLQRQEGPCLDSYHHGTPVSVPDLARERDRWPQFVAAATTAGFASVHALPMRLRDAALGTLGLFGTEPGALDEEDLALGQALADVASIALIAERAAGDPDAINDRLQDALHNRIVLEQAKGLLAELGDLDIDEASALLRRYARSRDQRLSDVAAAVVAGEPAARDVLDHDRSEAEGA
jgi:hypothetical protein